MWKKKESEEKHLILLFYKYDTQRNEIILCYVKTFVGSPRNSDYQCVRTTRCRCGGRSGVSVVCIVLNDGFEN